ncbi:MAG TPA: hypothetical protein VNO50_09295 [Pyrinomonadaceae bacterium]|nr:hypothetical protein [Pyrinomonadaceae bacterium]
MSTELDHAREIAERIARRVSGGGGAGESRAQAKPEISAELAAVRAGLSELQRKISQLEAKVGTDPASGSINFSLPDAGRSTVIQPSAAPSTHSPWLAGINSSYSHPSQEKFGVEEATVTELVDFFEKEKQCTIEPGGKPCDHCAMCSSRGF